MFVYVISVEKLMYKILGRLLLALFMKKQGEKMYVS